MWSTSTLTPDSWPCRCRRGLVLLLLLLFQCGYFQKNNNNVVLVMAQEAPNARMQVEPFATVMPSFRQDFCNLTRRHGATLSSSISISSSYMMDYENEDADDIGDILQGVELHANILLGEFINFDSHGGSSDSSSQDNDMLLQMTLNADYPGLMARLMDEICLRAGCTWRNTYSITGAALPPNRTYTELVLWATETYDISVDWWMRSTERMFKGAAFIEPWYDGSIIMVTKKETAKKERFNAVSWLSPFDNYVWLMIVVTVLVSAIVYWFLEILNPDTDQRKYQLDPVETLWLLAIAFAGQFQFDPQTAPARLFTFSMAFWALLIGATYTANLASFLVIKNKPQMFVIESIEQAVQLEIPMCVFEASLTHQTIQERFPAYVQSGLLIPTTERGIFEGIGNACQIGVTTVSAWKSFQYDETVNGDCSLHWVGRAFDFVPAGFAVKADSGDKCTSLVKTVFDVHLHDMIKEGKLEEFWEENLQATATVFCPDGAGSISSNSIGAASAARRRRSRLLQDVGHSANRALLEEEDAAKNGQYSRQLDAMQNAELEGGGSDMFSDTTQLTLHNMGGVFLLHGIMSALALIWSMISWSRKHYTKPTVCKDCDSAAAGNEQHILNDPASSRDSAEERLQKMAAEPQDNGSGILNGTENSSNNAALDDLRREIEQLKTVDQKLAALVDKKER